MFDMFAGGALGRMTVFALNIMPYISASIIMQLLTVISPQLEQLKKEGEVGRKKNCSTRIDNSCRSKHINFKFRTESLYLGVE